MVRILVTVSLTSVLLVAGCGQPAPPPTPPPPENDRPLVEDLVVPALVAQDFTNPSGVAVQPGSGHVFVSMKERIVRIVPGGPAIVSDEIVDFPTGDAYGKGPTYDLGPLGLAFVDSSTLVVGGGEFKDGAEIVRFYSVPLTPPEKDKIKKASDMLKSAGPIAAGADSVNGEGNFYGLAVLGNTIFVTCNGDDTKGWISKIDWDKDKPDPLPLVPFIKSKVLTNVDAPTGATINADKQLVISQLGEIDPRPDSLLTFYDPATGKLLRKLETGLHDLCGIAYSPKTGTLYGVDFSWADPERGGLFRLVISGDKVRATKLAKLDRPTALAFAPDGTLYIALIGTSVKGAKPGQIVQFKGL